MASLGVLRLKYELATNGKRIAVVCFLILIVLCVILFTGFITHSLQSVNDEEEHITEQAHEISVTTEHFATVISDTRAYDEGETLTNNRYYPLGNTDELTYTINVQGENTEVTSVDSSLRFKASDSDGVFWSKETEQDVINSEGTIEKTIDAQEVNNELLQLEEEFGSSIAVESELRTVITYEFEDNAGNEFERTHVISDNFTFTERLYSVGTTDTTETEVTGSIPEGQTIGIINTAVILLSVFMIGMIITAILGERRFDAEVLGEKLIQGRFNDWVTEVNKFNPPGDMITVLVESLADLVDLAIDTRNRVIHDTSTGEYIVIGDDVIYIYHSDLEDSAEAYAVMYGMFGEGQRLSSDELQEDPWEVDGEGGMSGGIDFDDSQNVIPESNDTEEQEE